MRKSAISAAAVVSSVALLVVGAPTASQAQTAKELNVCWTNNADGVTDFEFVADGPSYRTATLDSGDCMAWNVRAGQYKLTAEDIEQFLDRINAECAHYGLTHYVDTDGDGAADDGPGDGNHDGINQGGGANEFLQYPNVSIKIKRQNDSYQAYTLAALVNGEVDTTIKKERRTLFSVLLKCSATAPDFGL